MKTLVAATCVALLAAVGYYFWNEYAEAQEKNRLARVRAVRANCMTVLKDAEGGLTEELTDKITACLLSGAIKQTDIDAAIVRIKSR